MKLYCDLDGVFADLDSHYEALFGVRPNKTTDNLNWKLVQNTPDFFRSIPLMPDALDLWHAISHLDPTILTGVPSQFPEVAGRNKREWIAEKFGDHVPVITTPSRLKCDYCAPGSGDVLIDDWEKYMHLWLAKGGRWITHTSARTTINQLNAILSPHRVG